MVIAPQHLALVKGCQKVGQLESSCLESTETPKHLSFLSEMSMVLFFVMISFFWLGVIWNFVAILTSNDFKFINSKLHSTIAHGQVVFHCNDRELQM